MKAVILCGGQGTRIRGASELLPKPLLPIGARPVVWHIMKGYSSFGINDFVLCLGYKGWLIKEYFINYRPMTADITVHLGKLDRVDVHSTQRTEDWRVTLAETGELTGTGGRIAAIRRYVEDADLFCLTYGDGVADVDVARLVEFHRAHGQIATVTAVHPPGRFGEMKVRAGRVTEFNEKPQATDGYINGGFFVLDAKRIWSYVSPQSGAFEEEPLRRLAHDGELVAYQHDGFWQPMDTPREHTLLNDLWAADRAPWKTWTDE